MDKGYCVIKNILNNDLFKNIENDIITNNKKKIIIKDKKFINIINTLKGNNNSYMLSLNLQEYNSEYDEQRNLHSDSPYPKFKCWIYINDINENNGAFQYVEYSNKITDKMLDFYYNFSNLQRTDPNFINHTEHGKNGKIGSPRLFINNINNENLILKEMNLKPPISLNYPKNTLIIANTFGFHKRGFCKEKNRRIMLELLL